jgi:hypothetical protein
MSCLDVALCAWVQTATGGLLPHSIVLHLPLLLYALPACQRPRTTYPPAHLPCPAPPLLPSRLPCPGLQGYALFKHMTVAENITFGPRMRKMGVDLDRK